MPGKKVLIIDDDAKNIFALSATLKAKGYENLSATSAAEGIQLLKTDNGIGIVLMDMMMPGMDGYEALQEVKRLEDLRVPVIAVTAQAMKGDRERCLQAGADDYISKPINVDLLLNVLQRFLS